MPKWKKNKKTEKKGVIYLKELVNEHGSIFREVPGDTDTGIDGFIEFVESEEVSGKLLAVQVKSGDSYFNNQDRQFEFYPDKDHLDYWDNYMLPVVMVFYSPTHKCSAWVGINEHIKYLKYRDKPLLSKIEVPVDSYLKKGTNIDDLKAYMDMKYDSRIIVKCLDKCLGNNHKSIIKHFNILISHPDSKDSKIVIKIARELLALDDIDILKEVLWYLGYCVGRQRWSWNPNNTEEREVIEFSSDICSDISSEELYKLLCIVDNEYFNGPMGLGERLLDIISCCLDNAMDMLEKTAVDSSQPMCRRVNALYLIYGCDEEMLEEDIENMSYDVKYIEIIDYITTP